MAERQLPKLHTRVRFPSPAPSDGLTTSRSASRFNCNRETASPPPGMACNVLLEDAVHSRLPALTGRFEIRDNLQAVADRLEQLLALALRRSRTAFKGTIACNCFGLRGCATGSLTATAVMVRSATSSPLHVGQQRRHLPSRWRHIHRITRSGAADPVLRAPQFAGACRRRAHRAAAGGVRRTTVDSSADRPGRANCLERIETRASSWSPPVRQRCYSREPCFIVECQRGLRALDLRGLPAARKVVTMTETAKLRLSS